MSRTAPTAEVFLTAYPEFSAVDGGMVTMELSTSSRMLDLGIWADFYSDAVMLDCAHNLTLRGLEASVPGGTGSMQATGGPLTSSSAAGISMSFAQPTMNENRRGEDWYLKTTYGQRFLRLRSTCVPLGGMCS